VPVVSVGYVLGGYCQYVFAVSGWVVLPGHLGTCAPVFAGPNELTRCG
jgi:hypothetical protein